jgi:hypothetical protein
MIIVVIVFCVAVCFSVGTWPRAFVHHNPHWSGIIVVANEHELLHAVQNISEADYARRSRAIAVNSARAQL